MDAKNFAKLKKQLAKEPKKKKEGGPSQQRPVEDFFPKGEAVKDQGAEGASQVVVGGAGALKIETAKRKAPEKGVEAPGKKVKKAVGAKGAPVVISEGHSSSSTPLVFVAAAPLPDQMEDGPWPRENVQFSIKKGTAILHGTLDPKEFLDGATPSLDRSTLSRYDDAALDAKLLQASVTASVALGEHVRRAEQLRLQKAESDEALRKLVVTNTEAIRKMAILEESLRQMEKKLEVARMEGKAEGKAEAETLAAAAAKTAADNAEEAKRVAILQAEKDAVVAFVAGGWKDEDRRQWVSSVVEESVDDWVGGPGAMWLARKGKSYYEGGEYFTQANIYRKLARHFGADLK
ncbi:unnamed protein product, partial [Cuscuta epithymum]